MKEHDYGTGSLLLSSALVSLLCEACQMFETLEKPMPLNVLNWWIKHKRIQEHKA
jgi:hypothetical protein